jgi:hypothetical protein
MAEEGELYRRLMTVDSVSVGVGVKHGLWQ